MKLVEGWNLPFSPVKVLDLEWKDVWIEKSVSFINISGC